MTVARKLKVYSVDTESSFWTAVGKIQELRLKSIQIIFYLI